MEELMGIRLSGSTLNEIKMMQNTTHNFMVYFTS